MTIPASEQVHDSPTGWVAKHIRQYVESDGAVGHKWRGVYTLLLTTRGHVSGTLRRTALIYGKDGDRFLIVASYGGSDEPPAWYRNIEADPHVLLQVGAEKFAATARTAGPDEKPALWRTMADIFPQYEQYQRKTVREIPVVILTRD